MRNIACVFQGILRGVIVVEDGDAGDLFLYGDHPPRFPEHTSEGLVLHPYDHFVELDPSVEEPQEGFFYDAESGSFSRPE